MNKILLFSLVLSILSCNKNSADTSAPDTKNQLLTKIQYTIVFPESGIHYNESVSFEYDASKRLVAEGARHYYRDDKERIIRITDPNTPTNRKDITVHYIDSSSEIVNYTKCVGTAANRFIDSTVYVHDNFGRVVKLLSFFSDEHNAVFLSQYDDFIYDQKGNLAQWLGYTINFGVAKLCRGGYFTEYDENINPLYTKDEVRILQNFWGVLNISPNNFKSLNNSDKKIFEYFADGKPRTCSIEKQGNEQAKLTYFYE